MNLTQAEVLLSARRIHIPALKYPPARHRNALAEREHTFLVMTESFVCSARSSPSRQKYFSPTTPVRALFTRRERVKCSYRRSDTETLLEKKYQAKSCDAGNFAGKISTPSRGTHVVMSLDTELQALFFLSLILRDLTLSRLTQCYRYSCRLLFTSASFSRYFHENCISVYLFIATHSTF